MRVIDWALGQGSLVSSSPKLEGRYKGNEKSFPDEHLTGQASRAHSKEFLSMLLLVVVLLSTISKMSFLNQRWSGHMMRFCRASTSGQISRGLDCFQQPLHFRATHPNTTKFNSRLLLDKHLVPSYEMDRALDEIVAERHVCSCCRFPFSLATEALTKRCLC